VVKLKYHFWVITTNLCSFLKKKYILDFKIFSLCAFWVWTIWIIFEEIVVSFLNCYFKNNKNVFFQRWRYKTETQRDQRLLLSPVSPVRMVVTWQSFFWRKVTKSTGSSDVVAHSTLEESRSESSKSSRNLKDKLRKIFFTLYLKYFSFIHI
jgi:hypothetical protein